MHNDIVVIYERTDIIDLNGKISAHQTPDGITLNILQVDTEKNRIIL